MCVESEMNKNDETDDDENKNENPFITLRPADSIPSMLQS